MASVKEQIQAALAEQAAKHAADIESMKAEHAQAIADQEASYKAEIDSMKASHAEFLDGIELAAKAPEGDRVFRKMVRTDSPKRSRVPAVGHRFGPTPKLVSLSVEQLACVNAIPFLIVEDVPEGE